MALDSLPTVDVTALFLAADFGLGADRDVTLGSAPGPLTPLPGRLLLRGREEEEERAACRPNGRVKGCCARRCRAARHPAHLDGILGDAERLMDSPVGILQPIDQPHASTVDTLEQLGGHLGEVLGLEDTSPLLRHPGLAVALVGVVAAAVIGLGGSHPAAQLTQGRFEKLPELEVEHAATGLLGGPARRAQSPGDLGTARAGLGRRLNTA